MSQTNQVVDEDELLAELAGLTLVDDDHKNEKGHNDNFKPTQLTPVASFKQEENFLLEQINETNPNPATTTNSCDKSQEKVLLAA
jgi:hypothetical protein